MMSLAALLVLTLAIGADEVPAPAPTPATNDWSLTLPEAIRLGLINSEVVRVVAMGTNHVPPAGYTGASLIARGMPFGSTGGDRSAAPLAAVGPRDADLVIAQLNSDASIWWFKGAIMAHVRSVEQTYWAVWQTQENQKMRREAVRLSDEILQAAQAERGSGRIIQAVWDQAEQQLGTAKINLATAEADLATSRKHLQNILGLSASETRRIVAVTPPTMTRVEPNWDTSVQQMSIAQPDIALQREILADSATLEAFDPKGDVEKRAQARSNRERQGALLQTIVHQSTHALARFFLEIDADHKQYQIAQNSRETSRQRLAAAWAGFDNGEAPLDQVLGAVNNDADAANQETMYLSMYNTSVAAFEEARGTLLTSEGIIVTDSPTLQELAPEPPAEPRQPAATTMFKVRASVAGFQLLNLEVEKTATTPAAPR